MPSFVTFPKDYFTPVQKDFSEVARYLGYSKVQVPEERIQSLIKECSEEMLAALACQAVYEQFDLKIITFNETEEIEKTGINSKTENKPLLKFGDVSLQSKDLYNNLHDCNQVFLMAATLGPRVDMLIRKTQTLDSAKASVFQATGAMFIEKAVDFVNDEIKQKCEAQNKVTKPRYSPGYGDVSLNIQKDFFRLLPCTRIGLTLMDTLIMAPEKSVTAFVGVKNP